jgi:hypothetical protein
MAWQLRLATLWTEEAKTKDVGGSFGKQVEQECAEAERLMNDGWKVIATAPASSTYGIQLVMKRKKNA